MTNYYNLDGIKTALNKEIALEKGKLELWKKVEFVTKKDGTPFKILSKNIENATIRNNEYAMQPNEKTLHVGGWVDGHGYIGDSFKLYDQVKYIDDVKKAKTQNYQEKQSYLEQLYIFDLEDVKQAVRNTIEKLTKKVAQLEKELTMVDDAYNNFKECYKQAIEQLEKDTEHGFIYKMILDTIKDRYPYC